MSNIATTVHPTLDTVINKEYFIALPKRTFNDTAPVSEIRIHVHAQFEERDDRVVASQIHSGIQKSLVNFHVVANEYANDTWSGVMFDREIKQVIAALICFVYTKTSTLFGEMTA